MHCYYRPQTKFAKVMFSQVSVCPLGGGGWVVLCVSASGPGGGDVCHTHTRPPGQIPPAQCMLGYTPQGILRDAVKKWAVNPPPRHQTLVPLQWRIQEGRQPWGGGGANIRFCQNFPKNCMILKEFGPRGEHASKILLCRSATALC